MAASRKPGAKMEILAKSEKLQIGILVECCAAGVGRHVIDLAEGLIRHGQLVHILYSAKRMDARFAEGLARLSQAGAKIIRINMRHAPHPADLRAISKVRRYIRKQGVDVLHSQSTKAGLVGRLATIGTKCRAVYTPHAFLTMSPTAGKALRVGVKYVEWALSRVGSAVICTSPEELAHARELKVPVNRLRLIPNGIDILEAQNLRKDRGFIRQQMGLCSGDLCIGFVGRLVPQKAPSILIKAFADVAASESSARLSIVGYGPLLPELKLLVSRLKLDRRVLFHGEMDCAHAVTAFDVFALPSLYEGCPYVLLEALAAGLPIVATAVGGSGLLVGSENGLVVPAGKSYELGVALKRVASDPALRRRMGMASAKRAGEFNLDRMLAATLALYQTVMDLGESGLVCGAHRVNVPM
jgi:glycosyltransferase involved in cell wall biosynthesis